MSYSRFFQTDPVIYDGHETVGVWNQPGFLLERPSENLIGKFVVTNALEGKPHHIAGILYGDPTLDWVLIAFNKAREVLNWPKAGQIIEYPLDAIVEPSLS